MKSKTSADYQREYRQRLRSLGLIKKEVWILKENSAWLSKVEKLLREKVDEKTLDEGVMKMTALKKWNTVSLYEELSLEPLFSGESATIELIGGVESAIHLSMKEYGDLPIFISVSGDQIVIESVLWSISEINDIAGFNDAVLRTHKYFPLSTMSLDTMADGKDYYHMFGALSATSVIQNIVFEIEMLCANVLQAAEAYGDFLESNDSECND